MLIVDFVGVVCGFRGLIHECVRGGARVGHSRGQGESLQIL